MTFIIDLSVPGAVAHGRMPGGHLIGARARGGFGVRSLETQPPRPTPVASPADTVQRVLALARTYLRMDVVWLPPAGWGSPSCAATSRCPRTWRPGTEPTRR